MDISSTLWVRKKKEEKKKIKAYAAQANITPTQLKFKI